MGVDFRLLIGEGPGVDGIGIDDLAEGDFEIGPDRRIISALT
jgi:hypothetical protein